MLDGTTRAVKSREITSLQGTGKSIMPDGLEAGLSVQDFADLLGFLDKELHSDLGIPFSQKALLMIN